MANQLSLDNNIELQNRQKIFFQSMKSFDISFRISTLKKLRHLIEKHESDILKALRDDLNKCDTEAYTSEIYYVLNEIDYFLKNLKKLSQPKYVRTPLINKPGKSYYIHEPYGSVLIISPWNYPFGLLFHPLVGAVASGNCVIAKPSEVSKNTSGLIKKIISENFDDDYIAVVEGDSEVTQSLINENTDYIFFTGSTAVGKAIMKSSAEHLIPVSLELGGKNPCIVANDCDLEVTCNRLVWGKFFNAGQTCVAPDFVLVENKIKNEFLKQLKSTIEKFYSENTEEEFTHIINQKHFERLSGLLKEGNIVVGGKTNIEKLFISPTVLTDVDFNSKLMDEEIFGPILPVIEYNNLESAITKLNSLPSPLSTYFFSNDQQKQDSVIKNIRSGSVSINGTIHILLSGELPFGGIGQSGTGRYHGQHSFETFSYKKSILRKSTIFDMKSMYPPYKTKLDFLKKILKFMR